MDGYVHKVQYYETDKMGVVHHSNYIRWMEEARIYFLDEIGYPYEKLESIGIISPVVSVSFEYKHPAKFAEEVYINLKLKEYSGVKMTFEYVFTNKDGLIYGIGNSKHCFVDENGKPKSIKREHPMVHETMVKSIEV